MLSSHTRHLGTLNPCLAYALERMNPATNNPVDLKLAAMILRTAKAEGVYRETATALMGMRRAFRDWRAAHPA